jgi:4-amino-4-deoxy-L-arabinose transferase-like glycosyltransferase
LRLVVLLLVIVVVLVPVLGAGGGSGSGTGLAALALTGVLLFGTALLLNARSIWTPKEESDPRIAGRLFLVKLVLAGFVVRLVVAGIIHGMGLYSTIAPDEGTFHGNGLRFCLWLQGESPYRLNYRYLDSLQVGYFYTVGILYYIFGVGRFVPILFNCVIGALTAIPVYRMARELHSPEAGRSAAILSAFFPSVMLWSTLLIRDSMVIFVMVWLISLVMDLRREFTVMRLLAFVGLLAALGTLRQYLFVIVAVCAVMSFLIGKAGRTGRSVVLGMFAIVALFALVRYAGFGLGELERASLHQMALQRQYNSSVVTAAGSFRPEVDISEPVAALTYLPVGMFYFLGSPFPWQALSPQQFMALPDVLLWYLLFPPIFIGLAHVVRHRFRDASMVILCITAITVLYSLVEGNVGIIFRHRAQVIVPFMIFAGVGIVLRRAKKAAAVGVGAEGPHRLPAAGSPARRTLPEPVA